MKPLICIDVGAGTLKLAEFAVQTDGTLQLCRYAIEPLPKTEDGLMSKAAVSAAIGKVLAEHKIRGRGVEVNLCLPSHQVFAKPLRTPPVEGAKVGQIIRYEAQENVPFPLDEVRWDYQILGTAESGELDVLLMALKTEVVEAATDVCRQHKLRLQIIDGSITALRNAFMHNYGEMEECSLLLSIGARSTNVLFIRGTTFYARTINIGAHSITEGFAQEAGISLEQAEQFKVENGYVHLGGSFEESQDPYQAIVSKVARNVMTRLHQQVAQTIQFYRAQQAGPAPKRVYLAGGGGALSYTADFIQDKLQLPVEFFNPFRNVKVDDKLDGEKLAAVAHSMGELVGLGLRNVTVGMTEFNLLPQREQISRQIDRRSPYAIAIDRVGDGDLAIGQGAQRGAHHGLGIAQHRIHDAQQFISAVFTRQRFQPLPSAAVGSHLGAQIAHALAGRADIGHDDGLDRRVGLSGAVKPDGRDTQALTVNLCHRAITARCGATDIGPMRAHAAKAQ